MTNPIDSRWERDAEGHLSEAALAALADGQPVSGTSASHAESCDMCAARLAETALRSAELHLAIRAFAEQPDEAPAAIQHAPRPARQAPPGPALYIMAAVLIGLLASIPTATALPGQAAALAGVIRLHASGFKQVGRAVFAEISAPAWSFVLAGVFVALGVGIAVWGSNERRNNHGFA